MDIICAWWFMELYEWVVGNMSAPNIKISLYFELAKVLGQFWKGSMPLSRSILGVLCFTDKYK